VGAACSFEEGGDCGGVHTLGGFAVDGENLVAGTNAGFVGGCSFEGIEDDDLGFAVGRGLGLNGHADAVVFAVLVLAHLSEGLGVVKVRVGIEDVEHAGDGAVVDGLVGLVGIEGLGVVLLDERVDVGERVERVAQSGLIVGLPQKVETALKDALGQTSYLGRSIASWGELGLCAKEGFACSGRGS